MTRYTLLLDADAPGGAPCLIDPYGEPVRNNPQFVTGDVLTLAVQFVRRNDPSLAPGYSAADTAEAQSAWISLGIRATAAGPLLAACTAFVRGETEEGSDAYEHVGELDLNTTEADEATAAGSVAVVVDIEVRDAAEPDTETRRLTWQFASTLNPQVFRAADPAPVSVPTPVTTANLTTMLRDGQIVLVDTVTGDTYQLTIASGTIALVPVAPEET